MLTSASSSARKRGRRASTMRRSAVRSGMATNILTAMPPDAEQRDADVELVELRVLDGPNRFFTRPAVKLEFVGKEPGRAAEAAASAALAVKRLSLALELPEPRMTMRHSVDRLRTAFAFPWRRRTISQAIGDAAARLALGRSTDRRELAGLRATALGPLPHLPKAAHPDRGRHRHEREEHDDPAHHPHRLGGGPQGRDDELGRHLRPRRARRGGGLDRLRRRGARPGRAGPRPRGARDGARRDPAARHRLRGERRQRGDERHRRSPRAAGDRHGRRAGRGEGHDRPHHEARRLGRPQRRRRPRVGDAAPHAGAALRLQPGRRARGGWSASLDEGGRAAVLERRTCSCCAPPAGGRDPSRRRPSCR